MPSEMKVNKISPASGTAITLGDSGDTFTIPSGATITNSGTQNGFGSTSASDLSSGTLPMARLSGTLPALNGSALTALNATQLTSGTIPIARIADDAVTLAKMADDAIGVAQLSATGTASNSTFLRGDNSWATVAGSGTVLQQVITEDTSNYSTSSTGLSTATSVTITPQLATSYIVLESRFFPHLNHTAASSQGTLVGLYEGTTLLGRPYGHRQPGSGNVSGLWHTYSAHTVHILPSTGTSARTFHFKFSNTDTSQNTTGYASVPGHVTNGTLTAYNRLIATEYR
jgi:hypothetical protein